MEQDKKNQILELIFEQEEKNEMSRKTLFDEITTPTQLGKQVSTFWYIQNFSWNGHLSMKIRYFPVTSAKPPDFQ